jgi:hypothetical protein
VILFHCVSVFLDHMTFFIGGSCIKEVTKSHLDGVSGSHLNKTDVCVLFVEIQALAEGDTTSLIRDV